MDGLKAKLSFDAVAYDYDDEYLTIDTDTHTININNVSRLFGVQFDGNSKLIKFKIRNKLSDIQKMQDSIVYINWIDSRGVKGQSIAINKAINNDTCEFAWKVPFDALKNSGVLHFAMSAVVTKNSSSVIDQRWSTQIASVITPDGIYIKSYTPSSEEEDRIAQIYNELSNMINKQNDNLQSQVNSLKEDIVNLEDLQILIHFSSSDGFKINEDGSVSDDSTYIVDKYNIQNIAKLFISSADECNILLLNKNISTSKIGDALVGVKSKEVLLPENANYLYISRKKANLSAHLYTLKYQYEYIDINKLHESQIYDTKVDLYDGNYNLNGTIKPSDKWKHTNLIHVKENDYIVFEKPYSMYACCFDINKRFVNALILSNPQDSISIRVPNNIAYIGFNILTSNLDSYKITINGKPLVQKFKLNNFIITNDNLIDPLTSLSIWHNSNYVSYGDSITWYDGHDYPNGELCVGYQSIMNEQIGFNSINNQGYSGYALADGTAHGTGVVTEILKNDNTLYDLCSIACGTNDFKLNVPIGELGIIGESEFDRNTFYGAYRTSIEYLLNQKPTLRVVLFTPLQRDNDGYDVNKINTSGHKLIDYVNAVRKVGELYGIPVCDMYYNSGFTKLTLDAYTIDGLHPSNAGFKRMGNYATQFVNSIGV